MHNYREINESMIEKDRELDRVNKILRTLKEDYEYVDSVLKEGIREKDIENLYRNGYITKEEAEEKKRAIETLKTSQTFLPLQIREQEARKEKCQDELIRLEKIYHSMVQMDEREQARIRILIKTIPIAVVVLIIGIGVLINITNKKKSINGTVAIEQTATPTTKPTTKPIPEQPLPETGHMFTETEQYSIAPFKVKVTNDDNYYIYLKYTGEADGYDISFFVRSGEEYELYVPIGTYNLYYCAGKTWYGTWYKFGRGTKYYKSNEPYEFTLDNSYTYGHEVTMYTSVSYIDDESIEREEISEYAFPIEDIDKKDDGSV